ncbi:MAG: NAD(P)-dependent oxidoreductase [Acidimicrobiales bacterium]
MTAVGLVGLGNMGSALADNLVDAGLELVTYDRAGAGGSPDGARFRGSVADVARAAEVMVLSLPDGDASAAVIAEVLATTDRRVVYIIDTSTVGTSAAHAIGTELADAGVGYVDAPVSGGAAGARARTLLVMYAARLDVCEAVEPVLAALSDRRTRVGDRPGMAQAAKLANNFLSATALAATSEALALAASVGVDMATMLDVLNASSGQNTATSDKFPNHVLTGRFASGFTNTLMAKDLQLYLAECHAHEQPDQLGTVTAEVWQRFAAAMPGADFTRIQPFVAEAGSA